MSDSSGLEQAEQVFFTNQYDCDRRSHGRGARQRQTVMQLQEEGKSVSLCHFNYINPLPRNVREIFARFKRIVVCELNEGQFAGYLRQHFQEFHYDQYNKCEGLPFTVVELKEKFHTLLAE